jgi:hypothetical protein
VYDVDAVGLLSRQVLRERTPALVAETCAWSVGLSDQPYLERRAGRVLPTGLTLGMRADAGLPLSGEEDARLELGDAPAGSFQDALNALTADGRVHADRFEDEVLADFVLGTCVHAAERLRERAPQAWEELLEELGEDGDDLAEVVRAAEWEAPLRMEAEHLVLAALGPAPLVEVEAEGLPLSLVRAAEAEARRAVRPAFAASRERDEELSGALFLARVALDGADLARPVQQQDAPALLTLLLDQGLEDEEVRGVLPHLPVLADTADEVVARLDALRAQDG